MGTIKTHESVIDDKTYFCKTFPASEGLILLPKMLSLLGEEVANLIFGLEDADLDGLLEDAKIVTQMIIRISERAAETDGLLVLRDLMRYTECDKVKVGDAEVRASVHERFDSHFAGDYGHLIRVAVWVGRASFANP